MNHEHETELAASAIRYLEAKSSPRSGIAETFGHNYAEACRTLVKAAVMAGWIRHPHHGENAPCAQSSQAVEHPLARAMRERREGKQ